MTAAAEAAPVVRALVAALRGVTSANGHRPYALAEKRDGHCTYSEHDPLTLPHGAGFRIEYRRRAYHCGAKCLAWQRALADAEAWLAEHDEPAVGQLPPVEVAG